MYENTRRLGYILNDIFSIQKEYEETHKTGDRVDNAILISMEVDKLTFKEALHNLIQEHNDLLIIYRNEVESVLQNQDFLYDQTEKEKKLYFDTLDCLGITISHLAQTDLKMSRYKNNVQYEFNPSSQNILYNSARA
ncbi:unnamed protein product [Allacma fusca]|uniref:Uncharacterized protein n=1 Tax=Allacma fusca TaxID=39272 RepID=A0A8J2JAT7_9HEXA|nr:unnamed protein product [Allacma fusca]